MSWEIIETNPKYEMFRLEELEEEQDENIYITEDELENEQNEDIYLTEEELELIEEYNKKGYISISGVI